MSDTATNPSFRIDEGEISPTLKCIILQDLWDNYKDYSKDYPELDLAELISYGNKLNVYDKALRLEVGVSETTKQDESDIQEVYMMFLLLLGMTKERAFTDLEDVFIHRDILLARGEIK